MTQSSVLHITFRGQILFLFYHSLLLLSRPRTHNFPSQNICIILLGNSGSLQATDLLLAVPFTYIQL